MDVQGRLLRIALSVLETWAMVGAFWGLLLVFARRIKIQKTRLDAGLLRHELLYSALTLSASGMTIGVLWGALRRSGGMSFAEGPASPWIVAAEFAVYFASFDLYFYALHRAMHWDPVFRWVHATHHRSTAPGPLTAFSFNPIEGILTGGFLPVFLAVFEVHRESLGLIGGFQPLMSIYVHCGHEFLPRWWYRTPLTGWLLTPLFHDQHHSRVGYNYGGFTTIWDRVFGTVGPGYAADFERREWLEPAIGQSEPVA